MIEGAKVQMGGKDYVVPALSFRQVKALQDKIGALSGNMSSMLDPAQMEVIIEIVHASLSRNYPELTIDDVSDLLDMRNAPRVFLSIMGQSGFEEAKPGEA